MELAVLLYIRVKYISTKVNGTRLPIEWTLPSFLCVYTNASDMCMTNMLTFSRFKRMETIFMKRIIIIIISFIMDELQHKHNRQKKSIQMLHFRLLNYFLVLLVFSYIIYSLFLNYIYFCAWCMSQYFMLRFIRDLYCIFMDCLLHLLSALCTLPILWMWLPSMFTSTLCRRDRKHRHFYLWL